MRIGCSRLARLGHTYALLASICAIGCAGSAKKSTVPPKKAKPLEKSAVEEPEEEVEPIPEVPGLPWAKQSYSPQPGSTPEPLLEKSEAACGRGDMALHEVAQILSEMHYKTSEVPSLDEATFHLRRRGSPYVMPRLWSATMREVNEDQIAEHVKTWAGTREAFGEFRCGLGLTEHEDGSHTVTALQVDVLAEVKPVPTQVTSGTWIDFEAQLLAPTSAATVLLLPPEGSPRHLDTKLTNGRAKARFAIETEGTWLLQLMATQSGGPRPVAQVLVTADRTPPATLDGRPVPGEKALDEKKAPADALFELLNAAREDQGLPLLKRNRTLDRTALLHSKSMLKKGRISHDTGEGDPAHRVEQSGLHPKATGENVAMAGSVVRLHRVLWASPSHRENLLLRRWDQAGIAIATGDDGTMYATQLFIDQD